MTVYKRLRSPAGTLTVSLLAGIVFLLGSAAVYLNSDGFEKRVLAAVNNNIPGTVAWDNIRIFPGSGQLTVKGVSLKDRSDRQILKIKELGIDIRLRNLLNNALVFQKVVIDSPRISLTVAEDGRTNIEDALVSGKPQGIKEKTDPDTFPAHVMFKKIQIDNGRISLDIPDRGFRISAAIPKARVENFDAVRLEGKVKLDAREVDFRMKDLVRRIEAFHIDTRLTGQTVEIYDAQLRSKEADVDIAGTINRIGSDPRVDLKLSSEIRLAPAAALLEIETQTSGTLTANATFKGGFDAPDATILLSADKFDVAGHAFRKLTLNSRLDGHQMTLAPSKVQTAYGTLALSGKADLSFLFQFLQESGPANMDSVAYAVQARMEHTDISPILKIQSPVKGFADTDISFTGKGIDPQQMTAAFEIKTKVRDISAVGERKDPLTVILSGRIENGGISVPEIEMAALGATASGNAVYRFDTGQLRHHLSMVVPDLSPFSFLIGSPASGSLQIDADLTGRADRPGVRLAFSGKGLTVAGAQIQTVSGKGTVETRQPLTGDLSFTGTGIVYDQARIHSAEAKTHLHNGRLFIETLNVTGYGSGINARGSLQLFKPSTIDFDLSDMNLELSGERIDLSQVYSGASGLVSVSGHLAGSPDRPEGKFTVSGSRIRIHDEQIEQLTASADIVNGEIRVDDVAVTVTSNAVIKGFGRYNIRQKTVDATVGAHAFPLYAVAELRERIGDHGTADIGLKISGQIDNPVVDADIAIKGMKLGEAYLPHMAASFNLREKSVNLEGNFYGDWKGRYDLATKRFELKMVTDGLQLAPYMRMAGQNDLAGELRGRLMVAGNADNLSAIHADLDISRLTLLFREAEVLKSDRIRLRMDNGKISTPGTVFSLFEKGTGQVWVENSEKAQPVFVAHIRLPMTAIDTVIEQISAPSGELLADVRISGGLAHPDMEGALTVHGVGMALPVIENEVSGLNGSIHFKNNRLSSDNLTGFLGDGRFEVTGMADIEENRLKTAVLQVKCVQLPLDITSTMDLKVDGELQFSGNMAQSSLTGNLSLVEGRYYKDVRIDLAGIAKPQRSPGPDVKKEPNPFLAGMMLDIDVEKKAPFLVENNLFTMAVSPDLTLHGTGAAPLISGRASVDEGIIRFQKKEFEIKKGVVDFLDPYRIVPTVDLEAQADIRTWQVTLKLSGPADNLDFVLISDPKESHADILSLIALGKTTRELRSSQGGTNFSPARILSDFLAETVQQNVKAQTGLDQVEIRVSDSENGQSDSGTVVLGKELSRQLSVQYGVEIRGGENLQRVSSDYRVLESLIMNAYQDSAGDFGGAVKLRLEF